MKFRTKARHLYEQETEFVLEGLTSKQLEKETFEIMADEVGFVEGGLTKKFEGMAWIWVYFLLELF